VTFLFTPKLIRKAVEKNYVVRDRYKKDKPYVPTMGGLAIFAGVMVSLIVAQFLAQDTEIARTLLIFYFIVVIFAMFGLADDLFDVGRKLKIFLPFFLALPIAQLNLDTNISLLFTEVEIGILYSFIIAPMYVMVVANLVNMHSGYNGLSCGLSYILLVFIAVKVYMDSGLENLFYIMPILGAMLAFLYHNTFPASMFEGNTGALMFGSAIGGFIVLNSIEIFGVIILIPHIINFLMYVVWRIKKLGEIKFGELREDGTIKVPNPWTLKWTLPYYFRLTEHQGMWIMYILTTVFGVIGLSVT
jgi:UDP-N-acetylglucosamine--dolichyl-phosphate N-acetylglucosaminephosphotransferase